MFYGWIVLLGVMMVIFIAGTTLFGAFAVFLPVMCREFAWSRAEVAGALSVGILSFGLPSPLFGILITKFGPRSNIILGNVLAAIGVAGMFFVQEVWHVYVLYVLIGLGGGFGGYIAGTTIINNWFVKKRSLALGLFMACGGLGGLVFPPTITALIGTIGWRPTWLVLAGLFIIAVLIGGVLLIRNRPADMGLRPDGAPADAAAGVTENESKREKDSVQTSLLRQVVNTPVTWFILAFISMGAFSMGTITTHQIAYVQDIGFSAMTAASVASVMAVSQTCGSLSMGALGLRFNIRYLTCIAFLFQITGLIILVTTRTLSIIYVYAACVGISWGAILTALPTFIANNYRRDRYAQVMGFIFPFQVLSQAISATVAGIVFDVTGQYTLIFTGLIGFGVIGFVSAVLARGREKRQSI
ncbi:MAG: MFS transporter [Dehalococcoidales bacterium]|nr:MFS transporter [Dehalococcoidales bacterium]